MASIALSFRSSGASRSRRRAFCASLLARDGLLVDFEKHAVDAGRHAGSRQRVDVLGQARRHPVAGARQLQAVRDVEDDRHAERTHDGEGAHVDDQVVVAKRRAAFGDEHVGVAGCR